MTAQQAIKTIRDPMNVLKLIGVFATIFLAWLALYGNSMWYSKDAGMILEDKVVRVEHTVESQHQLHLLEQKHTNEKLDKLSDMIEAYYRERREAN
jgi:hypothetical protein